MLLFANNANHFIIKKNKIFQVNNTKLSEISLTANQSTDLRGFNVIFVDSRVATLCVAKRVKSVLHHGNRDDLQNTIEF